MGHEKLELKSVSVAGPKMVLRFRWDDNPVKCEYQGGPYCELAFNHGTTKPCESIHQDANGPLRKLWSRSAPEDRIDMLLDELIEWCSAQDRDNPGWFEQYTENC